MQFKFNGADEGKLRHEVRAKLAREYQAHLGLADGRRQVGKTRTVDDV